MAANTFSALVAWLRVCSQTKQKTFERFRCPKCKEDNKDPVVTKHCHIFEEMKKEMQHAQMETLTGKLFLQSDHNMLWMKSAAKFREALLLDVESGATSTEDQETLIKML